jgi:ribonuclease VapC
MGDIVIDSSALLAILFVEKDLENIAASISSSDNIFISAATYTETAIVLDSNEKKAQENYDLNDLIAGISARIIPFDHEQALEARHAYRRFGKGNHPAKLNMGDCFSYVLAKKLGIPLLYKGNDFSHTDIISALS